MEYEYLTIAPGETKAQVYCDCLENFGWQRYVPVDGSRGALEFRRDRKLNNKAELNELQRKCEAIFGAIERLERSKTRPAMISALSAGIVGLAFLAGAVFSYLDGRFVLQILLAVPGFAGCAAPWFLYRYLLRKKSAETAPKLESRHDQVYGLCGEAKALLSR